LKKDVILVQSKLPIQLNWRVVNVAVAGNIALADYFLEPYKI
jgi:hypothetical protein